MRRRLLRAATALPLAALAALSRAGANASANVPANVQAKAIVIEDRIELPPSPREFWAPGQRYLLRVETLDEWRSPYPSARLFELREGRPSLLWSRVLTQQFGPRAALVSAQGQVLLVDEWINVDSRQALQLLDRSNRLVATHDHQTLVAALGASAQAVVREARSGTWLSASPVLSADGSQARIRAGGRTLLVDLASGRLSSEP